MKSIPDIFVCSEVMGEGVDLQRYCRYVIHHDLAWNPSQIEQRTGRIDRLGCKAENKHPSLVEYDRGRRFLELYRRAGYDGAPSPENNGTPPSFAKGTSARELMQRRGILPTPEEKQQAAVELEQIISTAKTILGAKKVE